VLKNKNSIKFIVGVVITIKKTICHQVNRCDDDAAELRKGRVSKSRFVILMPKHTLIKSITTNLHQLKTS